MEKYKRNQFYSFAGTSAALTAFVQFVTGYIVIWIFIFFISKINAQKAQKKELLPVYNGVIAGIFIGIIIGGVINRLILQSFPAHLGSGAFGYFGTSIGGAIVSYILGIAYEKYKKRSKAKA